MICSTTFAQDQRLPIWQQVDKLICEGMFSYNCDITAKCGKIDSKARWEVNFKNSQINYLNSTEKEKIIERYYKYYDGLNVSKNSILIEGRLMNFISNPKNKDEYIAITLGITEFPGVSTQTTYFICNGGK